MGASKSFRKLINKFSSRSSLRGLNNNQSNLVEASSSPAQSHSTAQFLLPKNPAEVSKHRHDHVPKHLPKHTDGCNEVRYFLYTAFTVRTFGLTKTCPQWVLETCWAWKGKGYELLNMDDHALREICPLFPGSAPIDRSLYKVEDFPAPEVRELIGTALLMVMRECKAIMDVRSDHIQQRLVTERKRALSRVVAMPVPNTRRISADSDLRDREDNAQ
ncbi:hypothetical protein P3342_002070 [Pyrenophora teres f. teres]|nr:hypothetical protein P3342_002070 [Pyrenophora teres f. teres]